MRFLTPLPSPVLFLSDLPAYGRVAMALGIPLLEGRGIQTCSLPTALLSTHGAYPGAVVAPQTEFLRKALAHLGGLGLEFSAVYSGFVAEQAQFDLIAGVLDEQKARGAIVLVDPILGDNGKLYGLFGPQAVSAMRQLLSRADIITPNLTEAALLLGLAPDRQPSGQAELEDWMRGLSALGPRFVALTSAPVFSRSGRRGPTADEAGDPHQTALAGSMAVVLGDGLTGRITVLRHQKTEPGFPGTGDYFASVLLGELLLLQARKSRAPGSGTVPVRREDAGTRLDPAWVLRAARKATRLVRSRLAWSRQVVSDPRQGLARL